MKKSILALCALFIFAGCSATEQKHGMEATFGDADASFSTIESYLAGGYTVYETEYTGDDVLCSLIYDSCYFRWYHYSGDNFVTASVIIYIDDYTRMTYTKGTKKIITDFTVKLNSGDDVTDDFEDYVLYEVTPIEMLSSTVYKTSTRWYYLVKVDGDKITVVISNGLWFSYVDGVVTLASASVENFFNDKFFVRTYTKK